MCVCRYIILSFFLFFHSLSLVCVCVSKSFAWISPSPNRRSCSNHIQKQQQQRLHLFYLLLLLGKKKKKKKKKRRNCFCCCCCCCVIFFLYFCLSLFTTRRSVFDVLLLSAPNLSHEICGPHTLGERRAIALRRKETRGIDRYIDGATIEAHPSFSLFSLSLSLKEGRRKEGRRRSRRVFR